jgi:hypothetical protein
MIDRYTTGVFNPPFPEREKGELSLEFCCYKDTFGAGPFVIDYHNLFIPDTSAFRYQTGKNEKMFF